MVIALRHGFNAIEEEVGEGSYDVMGDATDCPPFYSSNAQSWISDNKDIKITSHEKYCGKKISLCCIITTLQICI